MGFTRQLEHFLDKYSIETQKNVQGLITMELFMKPNKIYKLFITSFTLLIILACNALVPAPPATPSPMAAIVPTSTPVPLSQQVTLISSPFSETNQTPPYTITGQTPQLAGSDDPRAQTFNRRLNEIIQGEVDLHRQGFLQNPVPPITEIGSSLDVTYILVSQFNNVWSLKLVFSFYSDGAAHPGHYSMTVNYDLGQGRELALGDLFLPNSNYLEAISQYCITELSKQPFFEGPFRDGAAPTPENYRNWNIAPDGLMITFDEYQVAPYAAGPQTVIVPYGEIRQIIDEQGPLSSLLH